MPNPITLANVFAYLEMTYIKHLIIGLFTVQSIYQNSFQVTLIFVLIKTHYNL